MKRLVGILNGRDGRVGWLQGMLLALYFFLRVWTTLPAIDSPRVLADTGIYLRISGEQILGPGFLEVKRHFVFPLLLKVLDQEFTAVAMAQLGLSLLAWTCLALSVSGSFRYNWLKLLSFSTFLALSLVRHLAGWDFVMMTESLSLSTFVLLIAFGIWLARGWRSRHVWGVCLAAFFFAFTRDTNAYLLAMTAGLIALAVLVGWCSRKMWFPAVIFVMIFLLSNLSADTSERWIFPFLNVLGKRILPYSSPVAYFEACGMPVAPQLLELADTFANGQDKAFFSEPALEDFRRWVPERAKSCYVGWLLAEPLRRAGEAFNQFNELIYFEKVDFFFSRRYVDLLPSRMERILYPVHFVQWIWIGLTLAALTAVFKQAWRKNALWVVFILLCLTLFPHLFITWHGDAMAHQRHAISVGLQLSVSLWLFVFLILEWAQVSFLKDSRP